MFLALTVTPTKRLVSSWSVPEVNETGRVSNNPSPFIGQVAA
jgi:hypothetical protein